jgi:hypothetical protein
LEGMVLEGSSVKIVIDDIELVFLLLFHVNNVDDGEEANREVNKEVSKMVVNHNNHVSDENDVHDDHRVHNGERGVCEVNSGDRRTC